MRLFGVVVRRLEKEQEGLVKEQIEELLKRITCLEAEVAELKRNQWVIPTLTEKIEVIGRYTTTGAGIE
jgi:cell division protein FtsB